jgi:hypothetical protein
MEARGARARTRPALGSSSGRCAFATGLPRSIHLARSALAAVAVASSACSPYVEGNCVSGSETRTLETTFEGVRVENGIRATVTAGLAQPRLVVSGDANLLSYIHTQIEADSGSVPSNVLHVWIEVPGGTFSSCVPPTAVLDAGELRYIGADGDSDVDASGVSTRTLSVAATAKSIVTVAGAGGERIQVTASDARVDASTYPVSLGADVTLTSAGRASLDSDGPVTGTVAAGCTLQNFGSDACNAVVPQPGATVVCPVP